MTPSYVRPGSLAEASRLAGEDPWGTKLIAGGTALVLMMRQGLAAPDQLVSLAGIDGLEGIEETTEGLSIGAAETLSEVADSELVRTTVPALAETCAVVANVRIRNVATLGGNVAEADYASDPPAMLIALGARCEVMGPEGTRNVAVSDIITGLYTVSLEPGEVITRVVVPKPAPGSRSLYIKYKSRSSEDRPCVGVACSATPTADGTVAALSVVVGAVAAVPQHFPDVLSATVGRQLDEALAAEVAEAYAERIDPIDDLRGSAWYRTRLIGVLVRRGLMQLAGGRS